MTDEQRQRERGKLLARDDIYYVVQSYPMPESPVRPGAHTRERRVERFPSKEDER